MFWRDDVGVLVAGDALWENGFGWCFRSWKGWTPSMKWRRCWT
jgi:hypothetical protein